MLMMKHHPLAGRQRGFTLIEVLVTMVLILIGMVGMMGMQSKAAKVEFESYQRGEALSLAREMQARLQGSRGIVAAFKDNSVSSTDGGIFVGASADNFMAGGVCVPGAGVALAEAKYEMCKWGEALLGAAAKDTASGNSVGAMLNARGCVIRVEPPENNALADVYVVIVWQAVSSGREPMGMAAGEAASPGSQCASQQAYPSGKRRAVTLRVLVPDLKKST
jgi:type IV pilus assembly protein PilV